MDVGLHVARHDVVPDLQVLEVVDDPAPRDLPGRHVVRDERRSLVATRQGAGVSTRIDEKRDLGHRESDPRRDDPAPARVRYDGSERHGEQRGEQPPARVHVRDRAECERHGDRSHRSPAVKPAGTLDREERKTEEERLERHLERDPPELEQPGCRPREHDRRNGDRGMRGSPIREPAEKEHGREHARRCEPTSDLAIRTRDLEDAGEPVHEKGALVVAKRREVEREARAVFVASLRRDRVGVVGDRRLVTEEAGGVGRGDPELERRDRTDGRESEQQRGAHQPTRAHEPIVLPARHLVALEVAVLEAEEDERAGGRDAAVGEDHDAVLRDAARQRPASAPSPARRGRRSRRRSARRSSKARGGAARRLPRTGRAEQARACGSCRGTGRTARRLRRRARATAARAGHDVGTARRSAASAGTARTRAKTGSDARRMAL